MDTQTTQSPSTGAQKRLSSWDLAVVIAAALGIIFMNVGVVRALDIALDAIH